VGAARPTRALDPVTPTTLYAGTGSGVFETVDGGATWALAGTGAGADARGVAVGPIGPPVVWVGTEGLFRLVTPSGPAAGRDPSPAAVRKRVARREGGAGAHAASRAGAIDAAAVLPDSRARDAIREDPRMRRTTGIAAATVLAALVLVTPPAWSAEPAAPAGGGQGTTAPGAAAHASRKVTGTIKSIDPQKGFVTVESDGQDVTMLLPPEALRSFKAGDKVTVATELAIVEQPGAAAGAGKGQPPDISPESMGAAGAGTGGPGTEF